MTPFPFLPWLRAACLPFVSRTLRGAKLSRTVVGGALMAVATIALGAFIAVDPGEIAHEIRSDLDLEERIWSREHREYTLFSRSDTDHRVLLEEREPIARALTVSEEHYGRVVYTFRDGVWTLRTATSLPAPREHEALAAEARALLARVPASEQEGGSEFSWTHPEHVERLRTIVARELVPGVERYRSPLGSLDAARMVGLVAGGVIAFLLLVVAPLLTGLGVAQEVHENTLQPLTGTALTPRQLVVGLTAGPWAQVGLLVLPQLVLLVVTAPLGHAPLAIVGALALLVIAGLFLSLLAELVGLALGRRNTGGIVAVCVGTALVIGYFAALGASLAQGQAQRLATILPEFGGLELVVATFVPSTAWLTELSPLPFVAAAVSFAVLSRFAALAFERRLRLRTMPALGRIEAFVAALTLVIMVVASVWNGDLDPRAAFTPALALLILPFQVLLASRVPKGEDVPIVPRLAVGSLLLEFTGFVAMLVIVVAIVDPTTILGSTYDAPPGSAWSLVSLAWALGVAALVALRVALPRRRITSVWLAFCMVTVLIAYIEGATSQEVFWNATLHPLLLLVGTVLAIVVPLSLLPPLLQAGRAAPVVERS